MKSKPFSKCSNFKSSKSQALNVGILTKLRSSKIRRKKSSLSSKPPALCFLSHLPLVFEALCLCHPGRRQASPRVWDCSNLASREILQVSSRTKIPLQIVSVIQKTVSALDQTLTDTSIPQGQGLESAHQRQFAIKLSNSRRSLAIVTPTPDISQETILFNPVEGFQESISFNPGEGSQETNSFNPGEGSQETISSNPGEGLSFPRLRRY